MYTCKYMTIKELIYPELYSELESKNKLNNAWLIFYPFLLLSIDLIRDFINGPIVINKYPNTVASGLRKMDNNIGAELSTHKFGKAADLKFTANGWTPEKLRIHMNKNGCFSPGFKTSIPPINQASLLIEAKNCKENLVDFLYKKFDSKVKREVIPFIFLTRVEWLYREEKNKEMTWFHMDTGNSTNDTIQIIYG